MATEPEITELPARPYVAIPASVTMETIGTVVPPLNGEVFGWLAVRGIAPAGPPLLEVQRDRHGPESGGGGGLHGRGTGDRQRAPGGGHAAGRTVRDAAPRRSPLD